MTAERAARLAFRVVIAAALAIDATIHLQLAGGYDHAAASGIGEGNLFRIESAAAIFAALAVLAWDRWFTVGLSALVLGSALAAVLVYRYVNIPAFGPFPAMYEPVWFPKKLAVTIAEAVGLGLAAACLAVRPASPAREDKLLPETRNQPGIPARMIHRQDIPAGPSDAGDTGKVEHNEEGPRQAGTAARAERRGAHGDSRDSQRG